MNARALVVTTTLGTGHDRCVASHVWQDDAPFCIGTPIRWILERTDSGVRIRDLDSARNEVLAGDERGIQEIQETDLSEKGAEVLLPLPQQGRSLALHLAKARAFAPAGEVRDPSIVSKFFDQIERTQVDESFENLWFKRVTRNCVIGLALFSIVVWVWPKPKAQVEELVPPQFAKIVMAPKVKKSEPAGGRSGGQGVKRAQDAAVVQAFRAKALQNAVSGLLKGGMTKLLAESQFVAGTAGTTASRKLFEGKGTALVATAPATGLMDGRVVKVGGIGGSGGGPGGTGVGYGKGEHAGIAGQGRGFVSTDLPNASVEEGLTKDEVGAVIHRHMSEIRYCYESAMIRTPDLEGKLIVDFTIATSGTVKSSAIKSSTLPDPRLDDCIIRRLMTWKFPQPKGGIDVAVTYPFIFKTLGR